jgi:hypothetical protein
MHTTSQHAKQTYE